MEKFLNSALDSEKVCETTKRSRFIVQVVDFDGNQIFDFYIVKDFMETSGNKLTMTLRGLGDSVTKIEKFLIDVNNYPEKRVDIKLDILDRCGCVLTQIKYLSAILREVEYPYFSYVDGDGIVEYVLEFEYSRKNAE